MKKLVVLSGSGISAESGLKTFRDSGGLWEGYNVYEVATPEGWAANRELVLKFYNERRHQAAKALPNDAHNAIAQLQEFFNVVVVTQNVDDLHEKAGSKNIIHLHGELSKSRSTRDQSLIYDVSPTNEINLGDVCELGSQLRPHIVWFGEAVPLIEAAAEEVMSAEAMIIVGTSMQVYPAAGLVSYAPKNIPILVVDPNLPPLDSRLNIIPFPDVASKGMIAAKKYLMENLM